LENTDYGTVSSLTDKLSNYSIAKG